MIRLMSKLKVYFCSRPRKCTLDPRRSWTTGNRRRNPSSAI